MGVGSSAPWSVSLSNMISQSLCGCHAHFRICHWQSFNICHSDNLNVIAIDNQLQDQNLQCISINYSQSLCWAKGGAAGRPREIGAWCCVLCVTDPILPGQGVGRQTQPAEEHAGTHHLGVHCIRRIAESHPGILWLLYCWLLLRSVDYDIYRLLQIQVCWETGIGILLGSIIVLWNQPGFLLKTNKWLKTKTCIIWWKKILAGQALRYYQFFKGFCQWQLGRLGK